jgi:pimeloyl-ACP methyl ester carboxylesterase
MNLEIAMTKSRPTIVLVHGAWADGSSWNKVIPILQDKGYEVLAVQNPLTSIDDDAAATSRIIADIEGAVVLVGHSWGGMAVTQAGVDPKVAALVYVSAFAPDAGDTGSSLIGAHPTPPALSTIVTDSAGFVYQTTQGVVENVAPDVPVAEAKIMAATQGRLRAAAFGQTVSAVAWKTKPSWYVLTTEDRVVNADLQASLSRRMNARTTLLKSSHMSLLSHPGEVAAIIENAAATVEGS